MANEKQKETSSIKVLDKAVNILKLLASSQDAMLYSISDIAEELNMSKTTVHRILSSLTKHNLIYKDEDSKKYHLGWELYRLGHRVPKSTNIYDKIYSYVEALANDIDETTSLACLDGDRGLVVDSYKRGKGLKIEVPIGEREPLYATAYGKSLLIDLSESELEELFANVEFEKFTDQTLSTVKELYQELDRSRKRGYTMSREEYIVGVVGLAHPIRDHLGKVVAAVSISGPIQRINEEKFEQLTKKLSKYAFQASRQLGFIGNSLFDCD